MWGGDVESWRFLVWLFVCDVLFLKCELSWIGVM